MRCNVGTTERIIRFLVALGLMTWAFVGLEGTARYVVFGLAFLPLLTGVFRFCPLWTVLGVNTCKESERS